MGSSTARSLRLLSLLDAREHWDSVELSERLGVSRRTLRRDVEMLRDLGYPIRSTRGSGGGYRMGDGTRLAPVVFDADQAVAAMVALQSAPTTILGLEHAGRQALATLREVMPERLRTEADSLRLTAVPNLWEFAAPPIEPDVVRAVGAAVRSRHLLRLRYREHPERPAADEPPRRVEPHHLVLWAGRWYLVVFDPASEHWSVLRVDRVEPAGDTWVEFPARSLPGDDVAEFVMTSVDRGDTLAAWPCIGSVVYALPAVAVARFAPSGSVVERVDDAHTRLRLGAWSWSGVAGLVATFGADFGDVEPAELRARFARLAAQAGRAADGEPPGA